MGNRMDEIPVSKKLNKTVEDTLKMIETRHKKTVRKRWIAGIGSAAAVCIGFMLWGSANPALAAKLPLIGHIFEQMETKVSDKGEYSKDSIRLVEEAPAKSGQVGEKETEAAQNQADNPYVQTSNGITCTISEVTYTKKALYLAMSLESEKAFPSEQERAGEVIGGGERLRIASDCKIEGIEDAAVHADYAEGQFLDDHTFAGIIRVDIAHMTHYPTEEMIRAAGMGELFDATQDPELTDAQWQKLWEDYEAELKKQFPDIGQAVEVPDAFTFRMDISRFFSRDSDYDGNGAWKFSFDVKLDNSKLHIVEINQTNESGEGILSVEKTPYELTVQAIIPEGKQETDYIVIVCDADGDLLNWQGDIADTFQTYGRNTDTVSVFLCDEAAYMDELKGYYWAEDYAEKRKTRTFAQYLQEHALYGTQVTFTG